ncbi:MAG: hypothetical protein GYB49_09535 [Alphaproteobacteria bacterium]|nr:hypothetical protein [Hyphomonas sp.]MBR9807450.1 hypothetical protein [Alphaproteobacteria bacterium]|tara:strand:- start:120 stop:599 length:480 start_codon:yes stop_codon:yes gene_type:complete
MSDGRTNIASKLYICATPQDGNLTKTEYEALTWVLITGLGKCGEFGTDENISEYQLEDGNTLKAKGFMNMKNVDVEFVPNYDDAGQDALRAAGDTYTSYAFKREKNDKPDAGGTNSIFYAIGKVKKITPVDGTGDDFIRHMTTIAQEYAPVFVEPTAGV